jgi:hypothetical protein
LLEQSRSICWHWAENKRTFHWNLE